MFKSEMWPEEYLSFKDVRKNPEESKTLLHESYEVFKKPGQVSIHCSSTPKLHISFFNTYLPLFLAIRIYLK